MKVDYTTYSDGTWTSGASSKDRQLVMVHASSAFLADSGSEVLNLRATYPDAHIVATCGQCLKGDHFAEKCCQVAAIKFERGDVKVAALDQLDPSGKKSLAKSLLKQLPSKDLVHVYLIVNSAQVNCQELFADLGKELDDNVSISGCLGLNLANAEDQLLFYQEKPKLVVAIGFYKPIEVHHRVESGWKGFGLSYTVTKASGNWIQEINGAPAFNVLEDYFGPLVAKLPDIAWIHPLHVRSESEDPRSLASRSVLSVDRETGAIYTGSDLPKGTQFRFMMTTPKSLIQATQLVVDPLHHQCVTQSKESGYLLANFAAPRFHFLQERAAAEVAALKKITQYNISPSVFYSHGQIFRNRQGQIDVANMGVGLTLFFD